MQSPTIKWMFAINIILSNYKITTEIPLDLSRDLLYVTLKINEYLYSGTLYTQPE